MSISLILQNVYNNIFFENIPDATLYKGTYATYFIYSLLTTRMVSMYKTVEIIIHLVYLKIQMSNK